MLNDDFVKLILDDVAQWTLGPDCQEIAFYADYALVQHVYVYSIEYVKKTEKTTNSKSFPFCTTERYFINH